MKKISVGSLNPSGVEGEYIEKCNKCKRAVYLSDRLPFEIDGILCIDCASKMKDFKIGVADETARKMGMSKKELIEVGKDIIEAKRQQKIGFGG